MEIPVEQPQQAQEAEGPRAFHELPMPVRSFAGLGKAHYRIYDSGKCKEVEAETAAEALKASGVETPLRIEREIHSNELLIGLNKLLGDSAPVSAAGAEAAAPPPAADAAAAAQNPA